MARDCGVRVPPGNLYPGGNRTWIHDFIRRRRHSPRATPKASRRCSKQDPGLATARSQVSHPTLLQCLVLTMPPVDTLESLIDLLAEHGAELTDPLIAASGMDNVRAMGKLLDLGADIEGNGRWSPLEEALYFGNGTALKLLLDRGASATQPARRRGSGRHGVHRSLLRRGRRAYVGRR